MAMLQLKLQGDGVEKMRSITKALANDAKLHPAMSRALNHTGGVARTAVYRALAPQTGLKIKTTRKAVRLIKSSPSTMVALLESTGGDVGLKHFGARETRGGVSAAPFGKRQVFPLTFIRGGRWPKRVALPYGNTVFQVTDTSNTWGRSFTKAQSGVVIPEEMIKGKSADEFNRIAETRLPKRVMHEIKRMTKGMMG